jgi:NAD(P)H-nitrite reductase large subunit
MDSDPLHPAIRGLKTVCRCNNIKYRTIERAIRDGALSVSQVAARTTATTGECGGTCTPEVQAMIEELGAARRAAMAAEAAEKPAAPSEPAAAQPWWVRK